MKKIIIATILSVVMFCITYNHNSNICIGLQNCVEALAVSSGDGNSEYAYGTLIKQSYMGPVARYRQVSKNIRYGYANQYSSSYYVSEAYYIQCCLSCTDQNNACKAWEQDREC